MSHSLSAEFIHQRFVHSSHQRIQKVAKLGIHTGLPKSIPKISHHCSACVIYPRYLSFPITWFFPQNISSQALTFIFTPVFQQDILSKIHLCPHHWWCHHQPHLWISHKIKYSSTPTHPELYQVLLSPRLQMIHILCWWGRWAFPIVRLSDSLSWPWYHCQIHRQICLIHKWANGSSPPDHQ